MTYIISHYVPYEGDSEVFQGTEEECREWYKKNKESYCLDDLTVYRAGPDTYTFFNGDD